MPLNTLKPLMNKNFFVAAATTMMVVWRMDSTLFHQRLQRPSAASAAQRVADSQPVPRDPDWFFRNFGEGLGIERPLNALKPLINTI
jgi:hypothetical protein